MIRNKSLAYSGETLLYDNYELLWKDNSYNFDEVSIGNQIWMAKNLDIDDGGNGIKTAAISFDSGQSYQTAYYYTQNAARRIANSIEGWHLPSDNEFKKLINFAGGSAVAGKYLKSTYGWSGTQTLEDGKKHSATNGLNYYGFNAFPFGDTSTAINASIYGAYIGASFCSNDNGPGVWSGNIHRCHIGPDDRARYDTPDELGAAYNYMFTVRLIKDA